MKKILTFLVVLFCISSYGQDKKRIGFLNLVGNYIQVPKGCSAQSEYELQACNGTSIKWEYYSDDMLSTVFETIISTFEAGNSSKTEISFTSFGAELKGYKFKMGSTFQYFLMGTIKEQPLMINLGTPSDISGKADLEGILKLVFDEVGVG